MFYALTNDLYNGPLMLCNGATVDELIDQLGMWHVGAGLTPHEETTVRVAIEGAQPPSDGLQGCAVAHCFVCGLRITVQCDETCPAVAEAIVDARLASEPLKLGETMVSVPFGVDAEAIVAERTTWNLPSGHVPLQRTPASKVQLLNLTAVEIEQAAEAGGYYGADYKTPECEAIWVDEKGVTIAHYQFIYAGNDGGFELGNMYITVQNGERVGAF